MPADKPKILIQLDIDPQPSVFDGVVAVDSGVDHLFRHGGVTPAAVRDLVHGALFTRGSGELCSTAIFVGGSNVAAAEAVLEAVKKTFFGPFKVSVLFDANGANTTAAAAVLAALESMDGSLEGVPAAVLAATGPVGQRGRPACCAGSGPRWPSARAASTGPRRWPSRSGEKTRLRVSTFAPAGADDLAAALKDVKVVIAAGPRAPRSCPPRSGKAFPPSKR